MSVHQYKHYQFQIREPHIGLARGFEIGNVYIDALT